MTIPLYIRPVEARLFALEIALSEYAILLYAAWLRLATHRGSNNAHWVWLSESQVRRVRTVSCPPTMSLCPHCASIITSYLYNPYLPCLKHKQSGLVTLPKSHVMYGCGDIIYIRCTLDLLRVGIWELLIVYVAFFRRPIELCCLCIVWPVTIAANYSLFVTNCAHIRL